METAALWLARLDSGSADMAEFEAWRSADPRNAAAFARIAGVTYKLDQLKPLMPRAEAKTRSLRRRHLFIISGLAAAAAGAAAFSIFTARASASTAVGQRKMIDLPQGGRLDLNTNSEASWRFTDQAHTVWLERGELALTLPAGSPPCELLGGRSVVRLASGTVNARLRDRTMDITVLAGACSANTVAGVFQKSTRAPVIVKEGEAVLVRSDDLRIRPVATEDIGFISGWRQDEVVLNGQTLDVAIDEYNRYLPHKIVIVDPQLSGIRLGGRFATHDPKDFLAALTSSFDIHVSHGDDGTVLLSK